LREKVICPIKDGLINRYTRFRLGLYGNSESVSDRVAASIQAGERKRREVEGASGGIKTNGREAKMVVEAGR